MPEETLYIRKLKGLVINVQDDSSTDDGDDNSDYPEVEYLEKECLEDELSD